MKKQPLKVVPIGKELPVVIKIRDEKEGEREGSMCSLNPRPMAEVMMIIVHVSCMDLTN